MITSCSTVPINIQQCTVASVSLEDAAKFKRPSSG